MPGHPIEKLRDEHSNMRRVLSLVRLQLDRLEREDSPDPVLLANASYYMRKFPSVVHHPKEDLIFRKLLDAGAPLQADVERLRRQHEEIYALEDRLIDMVLALQAGKRDQRAQVLELGRHYLEIQVQHAQTEERVLFPKALELLRQADWNDIRKQSRQIEDPLFGQNVAERYRYLYNYLLREAADNGMPQPPPGSPDEIGAK